NRRRGSGRGFGWRQPAKSGGRKKTWRRGGKSRRSWETAFEVGCLLATGDGSTRPNPRKAVSLLTPGFAPPQLDVRTAPLHRASATGPACVADAASSSATDLQLRHRPTYRGDATPGAGVSARGGTARRSTPATRARSSPWTGRQPRLPHPQRGPVPAPV